MTRPAKTRRRPRREGARPGIEILEGRALPAGIGFVSALGVGVTGKFATIRADAVATDPAGDAFVTGSFRGTAAFDPANPSNTITTASTQDTFVAKYGPSGALAWVATFAGQATTNSGGFTTFAVSQGSALAVDASGNVFVAGGFTGTMNVTGASGVTAEVSATSATEPFVAKLDASGRVTWFDAVPGTAFDTDTANALALDGSGGAVIAGSFAESATFGATTLTASGLSDAFVARLNGSGAFLWAVASQGSNGSNASVQGVAVDPSGNVDLGGFLSGTVDFDPSAGTTSLTSAGSFDALLWKLDPTGKLVWAKSYGSTDFDDATGVAVNVSGDLYATGGFSDTVNFGSASLALNLTAGPVFETYVLKVDPSGNTLWADGLVGPSGSSKGQGVAVNPTGLVHVAGTFSGPVNFDPGSGTDTLTSVASSDVFSAGYDASGNLVYALQAGQTDFNAALGIAVNPTGLVSIAGTYSGSPTFGSTTLPTSSVAGIFVAQVPTENQISPPAPSVPVLDVASDSGSSHSDGITNVTAPVLDVTTAVASDTVELFRNGIMVASRTGPGSLLDPGPLAQGTYLYTAVQMSSNGLASVASASGSVTILTMPPAAPGSPTIFAGDDSGTVGDGITRVNQPRLAVVVPGAFTVQLLNASGTVIGSAFQAGAGTSLVTPSQPLADGSYAIQARLVDVAGNVGTASPAFSLTIDTTAPAAPSIPALLVADDSGAVGDGITNVRQPRLTGTAEPGSTVQLVDGLGNVFGSATAAAVTGAFTVKVSNPLADGSYTLSVRATDAAGNQGLPGPSLALTILATPPAAPPAPTLLASDDSGTLGDGLTNVRQPRLTGKTVPNATVQLLGAAGNLLASTTSGSDGSYVAKLTSPLADGGYAIHAVATDAAGNVSPPGAAFTLTILATRPASPSAPSLLAADDSGTLGDRITNVRQARLTGTGPANLTIRLVNSAGTILGSATATGAGAVTVTPAAPLADGMYTLSFVAVDAAGNVSALPSTLALTILATPPVQPNAPALLAADDTGVAGDGLTSVRRPRLTGTAAPGGRVDWLAANGSVLATTTASLTGSYQLQPATALINGVYPVKVRETDVAGNVSTTSPAFNLTVRFDPGDDFGDGQADLSVFRTTDAIFFIQKPATGALLIQPFGGPGDVPVNGDFFGTGHNDVAVYRPSTSTFFVYDPVTGATKIDQLGQPGDVPVPADYDGDGQTDFAVYRPGGSTYIIQKSATNTTFTLAFGGAGDVPVPADYFGNGRADLAVYRPSTATFFVYDPIGGGTKVVTVGPVGSIPVPADYEGLGHVDPAVYQPSTSTFSILMTATNTIYTRAFGGAGDIPIPGDFLATGRADLAVFRPSLSAYFALDIASSASRVVAWGAPNVTWTTLAPVTTWFTFGAVSANAIGRAVPSTSANTSDLVAIPWTPDMVAIPESSATLKAKAVDRAVASLALDGWRPGG